MREIFQRRQLVQLYDLLLCARASRHLLPRSGAWPLSKKVDMRKARLQSQFSNMRADGRMQSTFSSMLHSAFHMQTRTFAFSEHILVGLVMFLSALAFTAAFVGMLIGLYRVHRHYRGAG